MPKVVLEFEVTSKGEMKIADLAGALDKLGKSAAGAASQGLTLLDAYGKPMESAAAATARLGESQKQTQQTSQGFSLTLSGLGAAVTAVNQGFQLAQQVYGQTIGRVKGMFDEYAALGIEVRNLTYITGESAETMSGLLSAARQLDVGSEGLRKAMFLLTREIAEGGPALHQLGIELGNTVDNAKEPSELLFELADKVKGYGSAAQAANELSKVFGKGVVDLIPYLIGGREAIQALAEKSAQMRTQFTGADIQAINQYRDAIEQSRERMLALKIRACLKVGGTHDAHTVSSEVIRTETCGRSSPRRAASASA